jgi:hypothetical protein
MCVRCTDLGLLCAGRGTGSSGYYDTSLLNRTHISVPIISEPSILRNSLMRSAFFTIMLPLFHQPVATRGQTRHGRRSLRRRGTWLPVPYLARTAPLDGQTKSQLTMNSHDHIWYVPQHGSISHNAPSSRKISAYAPQGPMHS